MRRDGSECLLGSPEAPVSPKPQGSVFSTFAGQSPAPIPASPAYPQHVSSPWDKTGGLFRPTGTLEDRPMADQPRLDDFGAMLTAPHMFVNHQGLEDPVWLGPELPNNPPNHDYFDASQVVKDVSTTHQRTYLSVEEQHYRRAMNDKKMALGFSHPETLASVAELAGVLTRQGRYKAAEGQRGCFINCWQLERKRLGRSTWRRWRV
jgi:hypothetical protein